MFKIEEQSNKKDEGIGHAYILQKKITRHFFLQYVCYHETRVKFRHFGAQVVYREQQSDE